MAKDPAFLFYSSDFLTGTMFLTNEQVGIYMRLLCIQHQHGGIIEKQTFYQLCNGNDAIKSKFKECEEGFFNERLMNEMVKRQKKSNNLSANAKKRWDAIALQKQSKSIAIVMPIENTNEIEDWVKGKEGVGEKPLGYFEKSINDTLWLEDVERAIGISPVTWVHKFNNHVLATQEVHPILQKWRQHCVSWIKKELERQPKQSDQPQPRQRKILR